VQWYDDPDDESTNVQWPDIGGSTPMINLMLENPVDLDGKPIENGDDCPTPDIKIVRVTPLDDFLARDESIATFTLQIRQCSELLGATMVVTTWRRQVRLRLSTPSAGQTSREQ
jgi:hypothetical protein